MKKPMDNYKVVSVILLTIMCGAVICLVASELNMAVTSGTISEQYDAEEPSQ